ncbi:U32 family peptidase [Bradyrhizobium sp. C-145]|uniref:ubiquinone anaerobic biosynthesis protein UbiU n=1 Tax=Bradyrhizobium sp. C-145 TaxID=574727 RepID=UPI00201B4F7A|nr:peptidase U32 family protein [Bradyrhizobium sp. C-145]UQR64607.1 U32 family peptidase [Bradyrhizobium sp. C-145]
MELICPAGTPAALRSAIDAGADAVYCGFNDETNARNFPGLNFSRDELRNGIAFAHGRGARILVAINTFPRASSVTLWQRAVDDAVDAGADALIVADIGLMDYVAKRHPGQRLVEMFGARRVVLPRVLSVAEIAEITRETTCETEVFVFGGLCVMAEGRCSLSSYATGKSPNMQGVCSPASHVAYEETALGTTSRLGGFTINRFAPQEAAGYPTLCKGRFSTAHGDGYVFEDPVSLDATTLLGGLRSAGVAALKIEGRQRGRAYIESVVRHFRRALDTIEQGREADIVSLRPFTEGQASTLGAYRKTWR